MIDVDAQDGGEEVRDVLAGQEGAVGGIRIGAIAGGDEEGAVVGEGEGAAVVSAAGPGEDDLFAGGIDAGGSSELRWKRAIFDPAGRVPGSL